MILAVGSLAAALVALGSVVAFGARLLTEDDAGAPESADGPVQIENQSEDADAFVRFLLEADGKMPVQLDHQVLAPRGPGGEFRLDYNCGSGRGCNFTRLELPADAPALIDDGVWYQAAIRSPRTAPDTVPSTSTSNFDARAIAVRPDRCSGISPVDQRQPGV